MTQGTSRRPRSDATRNRERVLEAAGALLAEAGMAAQIEDIAKRAGVGVGTVCRNFPTKEALVDAVLTERFQGLLAAAEVALAEPDAGAGFQQFVAALVDYVTHHKALAEVMATKIELPIEALPLKARVNEALSEIVSRAQASGDLRDDIGPADIAFLFSGIAHAASLAGDHDPALQHRFLTILLDGLRPLDPTPLPGRPMGIEELKRLGATHQNAPRAASA